MPDGLTVDIHSQVVVPEAAKMLAGLVERGADRMDHGFEVRPECRENISERPSEYVRKLYFDTRGFGETGLGCLVSRHGANHVLSGTDYPYDVGRADPAGLVERVDGLSADGAAKIAGGNAARLLMEDQ